LAAHLEAGGKAETFKCRIIKRLIDKLIMPVNWLMYRMDPDCSRPLADVCAALKPYLQIYHIFLEQHEPKFKAAVDV
jgi:hypothetical protein